VGISRAAIGVAGAAWTITSAPATRLSAVDGGAKGAAAEAGDISVASGADFDEAGELGGFVKAHANKYGL
jgi:hypothetical protein